MVLRRILKREDGESSATSAQDATHSSHPIASPSASADHTQRKVRWSGIMGTGQSLSNGFGAPQPTTSPPAPGGLRLHDTAPHERYDMNHPEADNLCVVPLTEPLRWRDNEDSYPANIWGRTPHWAMAGMITHMSQQSKGEQEVSLESPEANKHNGTAASTDFFTVHSCVGIGGAPMWDICKGGNKNAYEASLFEAKALSRIAKSHNATLAYDAILHTHGETDALLGNFEYGDQLIKLLDDYTKDLKAITAQHHNPIMILSQQNTNPMDNPPNPPVRANCSPVTQQQWTVQARSKNRIICAGPKYQYGYVDGLHLPRGGYDRLGEKYGQVYHQTVVQGKPFVPLSPTKAILTEKLGICVSFNIPVAPLTWDPYLPQPHLGKLRCWAKGSGFEVRDAADNPVNITSTVINDDGISVSIYLSADGSPTSQLRTPLTLGYAMAQDNDGFHGGADVGRMGRLRDSDPVVGSTTEVLTCHLKAGRWEVYCPNGGLANRALYDQVTAIEKGTYLEAVLVEVDQDKDTATLDVPWMGKTGWYKLQFRHELRNYCVSFVIDVEGDSNH